jgi:hypothetical protein
VEEEWVLDKSSNRIVMVQTEVPVKEAKQEGSQEGKNRGQGKQTTKKEVTNIHIHACTYLYTCIYT